jgi:hypothetical protein
MWKIITIIINNITKKYKITIRKIEIFPNKCKLKSKQSTPSRNITGI